MQMKKWKYIIWCLILAISAGGSAAAQQKITAIETARAMALKGEIDREGNHVWRWQGMINGVTIQYVFVFEAMTERIYVARVEEQEADVLMIDRKNERYAIGLFRSGLMIGQIMIDAEAAERIAEKILVEIGQRKIIER